MNPQEICNFILSDVLEGEADINEALYALKALKTYAEDHNDTAGYELFNELENKLLAESEEVEEIEGESHELNS